MEQNVGLSLIHEADPSHSSDIPTCDIVFVHGLRGHPSATWTTPKSDVFWPRVLLPAGIPNARILTFGYDSSAVSFCTQISVSAVAKNLLESLTEQRTLSQKEDRPLIFVAHSLGGLIVKKALILSYQNQRNRRKIIDATAGIIFLGTPHCGGSFDNISRVLQYIYPTPVGENELRPQFSRLSMVSELVHMQNSFEEFLEQETHRFRLISFFEELPIPGFGLVVDKHLEPQSSYTLLPIHADHNNICKFTDISEPNYQLVLGELKKLLVQTWTQKCTWLSLFPQDSLLYLQGDNGSDRVASASAGTCEWIFSHKKFTSWMADGQNSILWICGNPGSGKSTLSKYISKRLECEILERPSTISVSFFFSRSTSIDRTSTQLLRSLIYQILSQCPTDMGDLISLKSNQRSRSTTLSGHRKLSNSWTSKSLLGIFEELLLRVSKSQRVFFIIDALDECSDTESADVLSILSFLHSSKLDFPAKLCLTGRKSHEWKLRMHDRPNIQKITLEDENSADIKRFIESHVTELIRGPGGGRIEAIVNELSTKAAGLFLWVNLVVKELELGVQRRANPTQRLELSISKYPSQLDGIYSVIIDRITQDDRYNQAQAVLSWVCFARRPLSLAEIQHALSIDGSYGFSDHETETSSRVTSIDERWIFSHLGGLVEVEESRHLVQFTHQTVYEYLHRVTPWNQLIKEDSRLPYPQSVHSWLAEDCLRYIKISRQAEKNSVQRKWLGDKSDSFLEYAIAYWVEHLKLADDPGIANSSIVKCLDWPSTRVLGYWAHLYQKKIGHDTSSAYWGWTALHVSAAFGLHSLALAVCEVESSDLARWDVGDANGRTPLSWAAELGHLNIVKLLLKTGASIHKRDIRYGFSPLHWACLEGHESIVEFLLNNGAEINVNDSSATTSYCTALSVAAARGHKQVVKLLLEEGADVDLSSLENGWTALNLSAGYGHKAIVELLINWGADVNIVNPYTKQTPLYYATAGGHHDVIRLLLEYGGGMPQAKPGIIMNIPMSWAHRVAYSLVRPLDDVSHSVLRTCPSSQENSTHSSSSVPAEDQRDESSQAGSKKRLRDVPEYGESNENGGSGNDPNRRPILEPVPPSSLKGPSLKLACPYFKFDPERYGSPCLCAGPGGWPTISRLKEHLYKNHFVRLCQKCNWLFESDEDLDKHYKAAEPCSARRDRDYGDGFDDIQRLKLKARTGKRQAGGTELEYWKWVYCILFPTVPESSVPKTPYPNLVYDKKDLDKNSYDNLCAIMRNQSSDLRRGIAQAINDPRDVDPIATILALINNHQVESVTLPVSRDNAPITVSSGTVQPSINDSVTDFHSWPFEILDSGSSSFPHMSNSWDFPLHESEIDSGFHSGLSDPAERDPLLLASPQAEFSCPPTEFTRVSDVVEDEVNQTPSLAPKAGEGSLEACQGLEAAGSSDAEALFMSWNPKAADAFVVTDANLEWDTEK